MGENYFYNLLIKLESFLNDTNAPILRRLNPGIPQKTTESIFGELDIIEEIYQLYSWRNGTQIDKEAKIGEYWIFKMGMFMSAERAIECYRKKAGQDQFWDINKFPLFESRGGEYYLVDCNRNNETFGMVFFHSIGAVDFDTIITKYDSLETLFETILECFMQKVYYYDHASNTLEFNPKLEREIIKKNNPKSEYWKII